jgi:hypothetical protein
MSAQEFIFSEFPEIEPINIEAVNEIGYFDNIDLPLYMQDSEVYEDKILRLLPYEWTANFGPREHLNVFDIDDYISMTFIQLGKQATRAIMETSIMASRPENRSYEGGTPIAVLHTLHRKGVELVESANEAIYKTNGRFIPSRLHALLDKVKFDGKLYELTRSDKCIDSIRILSLFCNEPAKKIQHTWLKYRNERRNRSAQLIQQKVLEWLYRPGGPIMRRVESHFYNCIQS